jgi:hypothetical protein
MYFANLRFPRPFRQKQIPSSRKTRIFSSVALPPNGAVSGIPGHNAAMKVMELTKNNC